MLIWHLNNYTCSKWFGVVKMDMDVLNLTRFIALNRDEKQFMWSGTHGLVFLALFRLFIRSVTWIVTICVYDN